MEDSTARRSRAALEAAPALGPSLGGRLGRTIPDEDRVIVAYNAHLQLLENRTPATVRTYLFHTQAFLDWLKVTHVSVRIDEVTPFHVRAWLLQEAARGMSAMTRSTELFSLRSFYRFLISEELCETNPAAQVKLPSPNRPRVEFYTDQEADEIIAWASAKNGRRWLVGTVILNTLRYSGLRLEELATLRITDVDLDARRISLVGKGRKPRVIPIPRPLESVLREYVEVVRHTLPPSPFLFANPSGQHLHQFYGRYGNRTIYNLVQRAGSEAGVAGRHFPHRWRHTYATSLVRHGEDIHVVQRLMGHSNIATTTRYLHLSDADLLAAVDRAFPEG